MGEKSKFTKREWIHLIITLSIIQAFIWWISFQFAGNSSALGYVSFAGTLISIILAVLAIGYTYGESHQQKNSSMTLANQIEGLVEIKEDLKIQAHALQDIQALKLELRHFSTKVEDHFTSTNNALHKFTTKFDNISKVEDYSSIESQNESTSKTLFNKLFVPNDFKLNAVGLILFVLSFENKKYHSDAPVSLRFLQNIQEFEIEDAQRGVLYGFCFHLGLTLVRLGLANRDDNFIDESVKAYFNLLLNDYFDDLEHEFEGKFKYILEYAKKSTYYVARD
ncbi:hypothetical protein [Acinetobacter sp. YH12245]|uniref:hypothetical protein n=1 Tax=Acinetobacter sp. YH12245 TaxID=2601171 RepID=UPI0015D14015|nr:hypothetical protein [Acinetobacter sp. YH12245]